MPFPAQPFGQPASGRFSALSCEHFALRIALSLSRSLLRACGRWGHLNPGLRPSAASGLTHLTGAALPDTGEIMANFLRDSFPELPGAHAAPGPAPPGAGLGTLSGAGVTGAAKKSQKCHRGRKKETKKTRPSF